MSVRIVLALALLGATGAAPAKTIVVEAGGAHPTIQSGVASADAGDRLKVRAGVYSESVFVPAGKPGLRIEADGEVVLDVRRPGGGGAGPGFRIDAADVVVKGFQIRHCADDPVSQAQGDGVLVLAAGVRIEDCAFLHCARSAVRAIADGLTLRDCLVEDAGVKFIVPSILVDGDDARLEDVRVLQCPRGAVRVTGDDASLRDVRIELVRDGDGIEVTGHRAVIEDSTLQAVFGRGIHVVGDDARVQKNVLRALKSDALVVEGAGLRAEGNVFDHVLLRGIVSSGPDARFEDNLLTYVVQGVEIEGDRAVVRDNVVRRARTSAIRVAGADVVLEGNEVRECFGASTGITLSGSCGRIEKNSCVDLDGYAIASGAASSVVRDNVVRRVKVGFLADAAGIRFEGNEAKDCALDGFIVFGHGIVLEENVAVNCGVDGFDLGDGTGIECKENEARRCGGEGFDNGAHQTVLRDNVAKQNRIDIANDGTFAVFVKNEFQTGGVSTPPEID